MLIELYLEGKEAPKAPAQDKPVMSPWAFQQKQPIILVALPLS
ncbi:hypothetical protein ACFQX9_01525 [Bradyrhizobium sp. GCM10028915]